MGMRLGDDQRPLLRLVDRPIGHRDRISRVAAESLFGLQRNQIRIRFGPGQQLGLNLRRLRKPPLDALRVVLRPAGQRVCQDHASHDNNSEATEFHGSSPVRRSVAHIIRPPTRSNTASARVVSLWFPNRTNDPGGMLSHGAAWSACSGEKHADVATLRAACHQYSWCVPALSPATTADRGWRGIVGVTPFAGRRSSAPRRPHWRRSGGLRS